MNRISSSDKGFHGMDQAAVQMVLDSQATGRGFEPGVGQGGVDGLRGWLFGFSRIAVATYCETWRKPRRKYAIVSELSLPLNELGEAQSLMKRVVAKIEVPDWELERIVNECVAALPEQPLRNMIRLHFWEGLSEREIESHTMIDVSTVHRRLTKAKALLKTTLAARGVDASWLAEAT